MHGEYMNGNTFKRRLMETYDLSAEDQVLVEAIAATIDRAAATSSARDARADQRLLGELLRTLYARLPDEGEDVSPLDKSAMGRALARARWN